MNPARGDYPILPPFHRNLHNAIKTDYYDISHPSTRVFWRAYAFGYLAETVPSTLRLVVALALTYGKRRRSTLQLARILRDAFGRRGLALFFGATLGGAAWLDVKLQRILSKLWLRLQASKKGRHQLATRAHLDAKQRNAILVASTFLSTATASLLALGLQRPPRARKPSSAASALPLVKVGSSASRGKARYQSGTLDFTLFLLVRAMDTALRATYTNAKLARYRAFRLLADKGDALLFVASAWRIMWVWFYKPWLLPPTYDR